MLHSLTLRKRHNAPTSCQVTLKASGLECDSKPERFCNWHWFKLEFKQLFLTSWPNGPKVVLLLNRELILLQKIGNKHIHVGFTGLTVNPFTQEKLTLKMIGWSLENTAMVEAANQYFYSLEGCLLRCSIYFE